MRIKIECGGRILTDMPLPLLIEMDALQRGSFLPHPFTLTVTFENGQSESETVESCEQEFEEWEREQNESTSNNQTPPTDKA